jgi:hypothetical protein
MLENYRVAAQLVASRVVLRELVSAKSSTGHLTTSYRQENVDS